MEDSIFSKSGLFLRRHVSEVLTSWSQVRFRLGLRTGAIFQRDTASRLYHVLNPRTLCKGVSWHVISGVDLHSSYPHTTVWNSIRSRSEGGWSIQTLPEIGAGRSLTRFCDVFFRVQPTAMWCFPAGNKTFDWTFTKCASLQEFPHRGPFATPKNPAFMVNCSGCTEMKQSRNVLGIFCMDGIHYQRCWM